MRGEVLMALSVMDAVMSALDAEDRAKVAKAFTNKYANDVSGEDAPTLSARHWQVLRLLAEGATTMEIARRLNVGERTANTYLQALMDKLNAPNRVAVVAQAFRRGML